MTLLSPHRFPSRHLGALLLRPPPPPPCRRHHSSSRFFSPVARSRRQDPPNPVPIISLELSRSFSSIPLVAEEDSAFLRSNPVNSEGENGHAGNFLMDSVLSAVSDNASLGDEPLTFDDVLGAIDRGGKDAFSFDANPATYWVLDPIDGTRGFLKGNDALYVVGLALVVEGDVAIGVMGCPNWKENFHPTSNHSVKSPENKVSAPEHGIIMIAHVGCGTWSRNISEMSRDITRVYDGWTRCFVNSCSLVHEAYFCIPESQTWESLPLSSLYSLTTDVGSVKDQEQVILLQTCCGSLCKYLMVASGRASVFILRAKVQTAIKAWDHAVGMICVHEAGGQVTDWRGDPLDLAADQVERRIIFPSGGVLVTNGNLHKQIVDMISSNSSVI